MKSEEEIKKFIEETMEMIDILNDEYAKGETSYNNYIKKMYNYRGWIDSLKWVLDK